MAYYLSKNNRIFLNSIIDQLKVDDNVSIYTNFPKNLADILRNAGSTEEFRWIKNKYTLRVREGYLYCQLRVPTIIETKDRNIERVEKVKVSFFDIANNLIINKPLLVSYPLLDNESDLNKLELWCINNNYTFERSETKITFIKNPNE